MDVEPPFVDYPRVHVMPSGVRPLPRGVHFEAIGEALTLFQREWATYVLAALIYFAIPGVLYIVGYAAMFLLFMVPGQAGDSAFQIVGIVCFIAYYIAFVILLTGLYYGIAAMALKQIRGYPIRASDIFSVMRLAPRLFGVQLCTGLAAFAGALLCIVPGLWVGGALSLAPFIAMDQNKGVSASLNESWRVGGKFQTGILLFVMLLVTGLLAMVGELALCVGLLATMPIAIIALCVEYFYFFPEAFGIPEGETATA